MTFGFQTFTFLELVKITFFALLLSFVGLDPFLSYSDRENTKFHIALVENSFTGAAYRYQGFYDFYDKHRDDLSSGKIVKEDLNYLTAKIPKYSLQYQPSLLEDLSAHLKQLLHNSEISFITDVDVHEGNIFNNNTASSGNKYDILVLGHQEYVTQSEYDNFKKFVSNGGTLMILTGNVFYAEVKYDEATNSVTLLNGHGLQFDGKSAQTGVEERWANETKQWLGSNFYPIYYGEDDYHKLYNNPFNFTGEGGGEEQYYDKTNPNIRILLDYNSSDPRYPIATYELKYGKGKTIVIGLASEDILDPCFQACQKFYKMINNLFLNNAIPSCQSKK